jgi:hypothetical protein
MPRFSRLRALLVALPVAGVLTIAIAGLTLAARAQPVDPSASCVVGQLLVKVRDGADPVVVIARHGGVIVETISGIDVQVVDVPAALLDQALADLQADPDVVFAEANGTVSVPEQPPGQTAAPCAPAPPAAIPLPAGAPGLPGLPGR